MSEASDAPHALMDPRKLNRKQRKLYYRCCAGRFLRGMVIPVTDPGRKKMLANVFGDDYLAHAKAGGTLVVVRKNSDGYLVLTHATPHFAEGRRCGVLVRRETMLGRVAGHGGVAAAKAVLAFCENYNGGNGIAPNKVLFLRGI